MDVTTGASTALSLRFSGAGAAFISGDAGGRSRGTALVFAAFRGAFAALGSSALAARARRFSSFSFSLRAFAWARSSLRASFAFSASRFVASAASASAICAYRSEKHVRRKEGA